MSIISPEAKAAQENARTPTGQFGEQEHTAEEITLNGRPSLQDAAAEATRASEKAEEAALDMIVHTMHRHKITHLRITAATEQSGYEVEGFRANGNDFDGSGYNTTLDDDDDEWRDVTDEITFMSSYIDSPSRQGLTKDGDSWVIGQDSAGYNRHAEADYETATAAYQAAAAKAATAAGDQIRARTPAGVQATFAAENGSDFGPLVAEGEWLDELDARDEAAADDIRDATAWLTVTNAEDAGLTRTQDQYFDDVWTTTGTAHA